MHESESQELAARLSRHRQAGGSYRLHFFDPGSRPPNDSALTSAGLEGFEAALVATAASREIYPHAAWRPRVAVWPLAADPRVLPTHLRHGRRIEHDLVWIGDWGDGEYLRPLREYLVPTVWTLGLHACLHGAGFPAAAIGLLAKAGIDHKGWLPNTRYAQAYVGARLTVHLPAQSGPGLPPDVPPPELFQALACGVPVVSAPWEDREGLLTPGRD